LRSKINNQTEFNFQPSNLQITNKYYAKYEAISEILDNHRKIVDAVHNDLEETLEEMAAEDRKRGGGISIYLGYHLADSLMPDHRRLLLAGDRHPH
jgi:hypothetical protein